jgi:hypothetical protein
MSYNHLKRNKPVVCKSGFRISIQANISAYCSPRADGADRYTQVELGFPNQPEDLIHQYAENPEDPCETVYPYVPVSLVNLLLAKHGGVVEGEAPPGVALLRPKWPFGEDQEK